MKYLKESNLPFILAIVIGVIALCSYHFVVQAATLTSSKVTISDSRAAQTSVQYDFSFNEATATTIKLVTFQFCDAASGTCNLPTGMSISGASQGATGNLGSSVTSSVSGTTITLSSGTTAAASVGTTVTVTYTAITNPSTNNSTNYVRLTTKDASSNPIDQATIAFAVLTNSSIAVSASVDPTLTFSIAPVSNGSTVNGAAINIGNGSTSASSIPFGSLTVGTPKIAAHDVTVATNATNGYTVTVKAAANPPLTDGSNSISNFTGSNSSPSTWSSPNGTSPNTNTGFFGYTTEDTSLGTGTTNRFNSNKWSGFTTSPLEVIYNGVGTTSQTTRVGWQAEANNLQPPGSYTGTVILVATPTY